MLLQGHSHKVDIHPNHYLSPSVVATEQKIKHAKMGSFDCTRDSAKNKLQHALVIPSISFNHENRQRVEIFLVKNTHTHLWVIWGKVLSCSEQAVQRSIFFIQMALAVRTIMESIRHVFTFPSVQSVTSPTRKGFRICVHGHSRKQEHLL